MKHELKHLYATANDLFLERRGGVCAGHAQITYIINCYYPFNYKPYQYHFPHPEHSCL